MPGQPLHGRQFVRVEWRRHIVISPHFKQITQDVNGLSLAGRAVQIIDKTGADRRSRGIQMKIRQHMQRHGPAYSAAAGASGVALGVGCGTREMLSITTMSCGTSLRKRPPGPVLTAAMASTTFMPSTTSPNTA